MDDKYFLMWMVFFLCLVTTTPYVSAFNLTILHTNDIHARIEEINKYDGRCSDSDAKEGKCYGGMERLKTKIDEMRTEYPDSLLLDGGDQYQGTLFFYVYGGQIMSHFMNVLGYNAMGLGNHEFDNGPSGLVPFLDNATFSILSSNIDTSYYQDFYAIQKSVVINISGHDVGIIGYTTVDTVTISKPEDVKFKDEIESIQKEADKLAGQGVDIIIALGHAGYTKDMEIAEKVRGVDVIVGGHSNTFLYNGDAPSNNDPIGSYPTVVKNLNGQDVLVVQDYAYGKYLGFLQVDFDKDGVVKGWNGNPILLDKTVIKDPEVSQIITSYLPKVQSAKNKKVGVSLVRLRGERTLCRVRECNLGNMMADAMVRQNHRYADSVEWNHVAIALVNSGSIRTSISRGDIMMSDILSVAPFANTVDIVELSGQILWDVLEHSAAGWAESDSDDLSGGFLQMSGIRVIYDMRRKAGSRVVEARVLCADCDVPEFKPLEKTKTYKVLGSSFLIRGGDGYTMIRDNVGRSHTIGSLDSQLLLDYLKENSPLSNGLDNRIRFLKDLEKTQNYCIDASSAVNASFWCLVGLLAVAIFS